MYNTKRIHSSLVYLVLDDLASECASACSIGPRRFLSNLWGARQIIQTIPLIPQQTKRLLNLFQEIQRVLLVTN